LAVRKTGGVETHKPKPATGKERRMQERFDCDGFAEVIVDGTAFLFRGVIQNFSLGGCYIESRAHLRLERGAEADLHFSLNGDFFKARARLTIVRPRSGAGFEFLSDDPELQRRLVNLIAKLTSVPAGEVAAPAGDGKSGKKQATRDLWDPTQ
jgi:hypothetical protein